MTTASMRGVAESPTDREVEAASRPIFKLLAVCGEIDQNDAPQLAYRIARAALIAAAEARRSAETQMTDFQAGYEFGYGDGQVGEYRPPPARRSAETPGGAA